MGLARRDTNNTSIRLDYSNVKGYWDRIVDSPSEQDKKARDLMKRYYSDSNEEWRKDYGISNAYFQYENTNAVKIKEDLSGFARWQSINDCEVEGSYYNEGFAAYISGSIDAEMYFGFYLIAQFYNGELSVEEANGFVKAASKSDLTYGISGFGEVDVAKENKGNPMHGAKRTFDQGTTISAGANSFVTFNPYLEMTYQMASFNDSSGEDFSESAANFDGSLST